MANLRGNERFWWGAFGASLPEILRFYKLATSGQAMPDLSWKYLVAFLVFVAAAGIFSVAWKPENPFKAIWVGISLPVIVSTLAQSPPVIPR